MKHDVALEQAIARLGSDVRIDARSEMRLFLGLGTALSHTGRTGSPKPW
jgi:hypothetical protein